MLNTPRSRRGMVTAPHHLGSEAGLRVLREGGNAIEATVAMAACLAVVYPQMNSIGGDGFWLVARPGEDPIGIDACGAAAQAAQPALYALRGLTEIPWRGPLAANTVAGTISGWGEALKLSGQWGGQLPLSRLVEDAVWLAHNGFAVTASQHELTKDKIAELVNLPGFGAAFLTDGQIPDEGSLMKLPALANTLQKLGTRGTDDFYRGALAREIAGELAAIGSPVALRDLAAHSAQRRVPLTARITNGRLFNFPPPTQGLSSLMILALFDRLKVKEAETFDHMHGLVEATKQAFLIRDRYIGDAGNMERTAESFLEGEVLDTTAARISRTTAMPWPQSSNAGDTVWMGAIDRNGISVSYIQSIFFEFGSGCVLPATGINWQNRGASFVLTGKSPRLLAPGRKPFHTLNPAMAFLDDGRILTYGTMGGEGQPQTQAAVFSRYGMFGQQLQASITAPRWLLGKTWGEDSVTLKLEGRFSPELITQMKKAGHNVEIVPPFTSIMGHAGAIVLHPAGVFEGAADPRSDGSAIGF